MAPEFCACRNPLVNLPTNPIGEQNKLADAQDLASKSNAERDETSTEAFTLLGAPISSLVLLSAKNLFTKFMKMFIKTTQAWDQE